MALENAEKMEKRCVFCCFLLKGSVFILFFLCFFWIFEGEISENF
jgi:hypothetical protein